MPGARKILIAPLDWGLGHATRCIPLIDILRQCGAEVWLAGSLSSCNLIREYFPDIQCLDLPSYGVSYTQHPFWLPWHLLKQFPGILKIIDQEHALLKNWVRQYHFDGVISDNRYGMWHTEVPSVFLGHQLRIQVPQSRLVEKVVFHVHAKRIRHFSSLWIPDFPDQRLSGKLSEVPKGIEVEWIGNLSRFSRQKMEPFERELLIILSGPEPQRTLLETELFAQLQHSKIRAALVRGMPSGQPLLSDSVSVYNHLSTPAMQQMIATSEILMVRSGYSTIMDLYQLQRHAILIPTPGQTEQDYLANWHEQKGLFLQAKQGAIDLQQLIKNYRSKSFSKFPEYSSGLCQDVCTCWLASLGKEKED
ncbi:MAG TPA: glycosyltransferase [Chitinophagaceae bacterium]|nr:glycosyltransferase [Chitinophagaceae bacterium]